MSALDNDATTPELAALVNGLRHHAPVLDDEPVDKLAAPDDAPIGEPGPLPAPHWLTRPLRLIEPLDPPPFTARHPGPYLRFHVGSWARRVWVFVLVMFVVTMTAVGIVYVFSLPHTDRPFPVIPPAADPVAQGYAEKVARLFLSYDPADTSRAAQVAALAPGAPTTFGWDGKGTSKVTDTWTISDQPACTAPCQDRDEAVAVVANGTARTVLVRVGRTGGGAPYLIGVPTLGSAPAVGQSTPGVASVATDTGDTATATAARPAIEGFLRAWGAGSADLAVFAAEGFRPPPGPGDLRLLTATFTVPPGGATRPVIVRVRWGTDTGTTVPSVYTLTITTTGARWAVAGLDVAPTTSFTDLP